MSAVGAQLARGANVSLSAGNGVRRALVGLRWDLSATGEAIELDAQVVLLGAEGVVADDGDLVFFSELSAAGAPGGGSSPGGDDDVEQIVVDLAAVPAAVTRIVVSAAIYGAAERRQSFGQVRGARIRVADADNGTEVASHDLEEGTGTETAMVFGELYRHRQEWKFRAVGQGYIGGLAAVARDFGVSV